MKPHDTIERRRFLQLSGAASVAAVAGCLGDDDDSPGGNGDVSYDQYISTEDDEVFFVYADLQALDELEDDDPDEEPGGEPPEFDDPMLAPIGGVFLLAFAGGFALASGGLGDLLEPEDESDLDSTADEMLFTEGGLVAVGDMDTDEIGNVLTEEPEDEFFGIQFEEDGELGDYTLYTSVENDDETVYLVGDDEVITGEGSESVESVVDAIEGDNRATDEFETFDELLGDAGDGMVAIGGFGDEAVEEAPADAADDDSLFETTIPNGFVSSMDFADDQISAIFAADFDDLSEDEEDGLRTEFESDRTDVSIEFDDGRLIAEATYEEDVLDESTA